MYSLIFSRPSMFKNLSMYITIIINVLKIVEIFQCYFFIAKQK